MRIVLNEKTKPILFLFTLSIIALGITWVVNQFKTTDSYYSVNTDTQTEYIIQDTTNTLENPDGVTPEEVIVDDNSTVLAAANNSSNQCKQALNTYKTESICVSTYAGDNKYLAGERSGDVVREDANVTLTEVQVPLVLLSGSKTVPDSNRKVTYKTPNVYKPAGEQIDEELANYQLAPIEQIDEKKPWVVKKIFSTFFSLLFGEKSDTPTHEGELVISNYLKNDCEYCNNDSNINPDKTNKLSTFMLDNTRYPTEKSTVKSNEISESCEEANFEMLAESEYEACPTNVVVDVFVKLSAEISSAGWYACHDQVDEEGNKIPATDECIEPEDIIVKISSMFGSDEDCTDDTCTNAFMAKRNATLLAPGTIDASKTYFTTPCKALIRNNKNFVKEYKIRCAWDLDYLLKERKLNEFDDYIGESTPSEDAYIQYLKDDSSKRGSEVPVEM